MSKSFIITAVIVVVVIAVIVFLRTFVSAALYNTEANYIDYPYFVKPMSSTTPTYQATTSEERNSAAAVLKADGPTRLLIPAIGVNANVQRTGINAKGAMGVPTNFTDVAWYAKGTVPGDVGSAVMAGHLDNGLGLSGVFKNLAAVKTGDEINVTTMSGKTLRFVVTDVSQFAYDDPGTSNIFDADTGRPLLRLVTCGGKWLPSLKTYDKRVIVTAELR